MKKDFRPSGGFRSAGGGIPEGFPASELMHENAELRARLSEAQDTLRAIREGEVDAIVVAGSRGDQVFSLIGAESVYRLIVETMKEAAFTVAFDGTILFANAQVAPLVRRPMEEILGHTLHELVAEDQRAQVESILFGCRKEPIKMRLVFRGSDGAAVPAYVSAHLLGQPDGASICLVAADLTELENSTHLIRELRCREEALRESEEDLYRSAARLQLLSNCAARLLESNDPQSVVNELCLDVMKHLDCQAFFNFMSDEKSGKLHLNACSGITEEQFRGIEWLDYGVALCGCAAQQGTRVVAEDILHSSDARADFVRDFGIQAYCCHPLMAQGRVIGTLSFGTASRPHFAQDEVEVMRTVADQVAVAMQRVQNLRALRELNESLERRVARRTSEVRRQTKRLRALAAELSQAEQRERKRLSTILHDHIQQLLVAAQMRLGYAAHADRGNIGTAIQDVSSIIREAIEVSRSLAVDLSPPILHQSGLGPALGWLAGRVEEKNLFKVRVQADSDAEPQGEAARLLLFESVRELLLNAVKHSGAPEARVTMTRTPGNWTKITVEDNGRGFDTGDAAVRRRGFGLFGIQQRLAYMRGKFEVESAPGKGVRITLLAPPEKASRAAPILYPAAPPNAQIPDLMRLARKTKKIGILLVDDHRIVRQGLSSLLHLEPDLEVVAEAENGDQALKMAHQHRPDVVVTDVSMPGMDGVELTRRLVRELPGTKVLGLSMHVDKNVAVAMREAGAADYITKGGLSEDLIEAIRACVRS